MSENLKNLKVMLGFDESDTTPDERLNLIIKNAELALLTQLPDDETVPDKLAYIVVELAIVRFNRLGNEGMKIFSQEGENITYRLTDDLEPFKEAIAGYLNSKSSSSGTVEKVKFL